jgi:hypothetical protein
VTGPALWKWNETRERWKRSPETDTGSSELTPCPRYERIDELVWVKTNQLQVSVSGERFRMTYPHAFKHSLPSSMALPVTHRKSKPPSSLPQIRAD